MTRIVIAISITSRYGIRQPAGIAGVDLDSDARQLKTHQVDWPPPYVQMSPPLAAKWLQLALKGIGFDSVHPSQLMVYTDGPVASGEGRSLRHADLECGDADETRLPGLRKAQAKERVARTSLEFFHALLWESEWLGGLEINNNCSAGLDDWRREFNADRDSANIFEVCLGQRARSALLHNNRNAQPQPTRTWTTLRKRLTDLGIDCAKINELSGSEPASMVRAVMLLLVGAERCTYANHSRWRLYGKPIYREHGCLYEGKVLGLDYITPNSATPTETKQYDSVESLSELWGNWSKSPNPCYSVNQLWVYVVSEKHSEDLQAATRQGNWPIQIPVPISGELRAQDRVLFVREQNGESLLVGCATGQRARPIAGRFSFDQKEHRHLQFWSIKQEPASDAIIEQWPSVDITGTESGKLIPVERASLIRLGRPNEDEPDNKEMGGHKHALSATWRNIISIIKTGLLPVTAWVDGIGGVESSNAWKTVAVGDIVTLVHSREIKRQKNKSEAIKFKLAPYAEMVVRGAPGNQTQERNARAATAVKLSRQQREQFSFKTQSNDGASINTIYAFEVQLVRFLDKRDPLIISQEKLPVGPLFTVEQLEPSVAE